MTKDIHFSNADELERALPTFAERGITELTLHDTAITAHKGRLLHFLAAVREQAPDLFLTLPLEAAALDLDIAKAASCLYCSIELPLRGTALKAAQTPDKKKPQHEMQNSRKNAHTAAESARQAAKAAPGLKSTYLFDKKLYARRADMLNNLGLVFGFSLDFAATSGDAVKLFRDRLDFAVSQYPNHIDFPQLDFFSAGREAHAAIAAESSIVQPRPTATFSTQDIQRAQEAAFACTVFYSLGRAVPWFLSVIAPLKMTPSSFFQDFAEWQQVNSCGLQSDWGARVLKDDRSASHAEIERMQLAFLHFKYEEKNKEPLFAAVTDIVHLNGALARCAGEGEEATVVLQYNPEDLLSPAAIDIASFADSVCMEDCRVKVFYSEETGVDWKILHDA